MHTDAPHAVQAGRITRGVRFVVVSPHRDDAAFSLGLSISHLLGAGHRVHVLNCFTQSDYAPYSDAGNLHTNDRRSFVSALRRREDIAWNKLLGGQLRITDLDLLDAPLRLACGVEEVLTVEIRPGDRAQSRVAGAIRKLVEKSENGELGILVPLAVGGHIDHRVTREAACEVLSGVQLPVGFYEDLPYAARPESAGTVEMLAESTGLDLQPGFLQSAVDAEAPVARKRRMAECYDSQIDTAVAQRIADFCREYQGRERLWVNAPWRSMQMHVSPEKQGTA